MAMTNRLIKGMIALIIKFNLWLCKYLEIWYSEATLVYQNKYKIYIFWNIPFAQIEIIVNCEIYILQSAKNTIKAQYNNKQLKSDKAVLINMIPFAKYY